MSLTRRIFPLDKSDGSEGRGWVRQFLGVWTWSNDLMTAGLGSHLLLILQLTRGQVTRDSFGGVCWIA